MLKHIVYSVLFVNIAQCQFTIYGELIFEQPPTLMSPIEQWIKMLEGWTFCVPACSKRPNFDKKSVHNSISLFATTLKKKKRFEFTRSAEKLITGFTLLI